MGGSELSSGGGEAIPPVSCSSVDSLAASETFDLGSDHDEAKLKRMQLAVRALLSGLGEDVDREGLIDTPKVIHCRLSDFFACAQPRNMLPGAWYMFKWWSAAFDWKSGPGKTVCDAATHGNAFSERTVIVLQRVAKAWRDITAGYQQRPER